MNLIKDMTIDSAYQYEIEKLEQKIGEKSLWGWKTTDYRVVAGIFNAKLNKEGGVCGTIYIGDIITSQKYIWAPLLLDAANHELMTKTEQKYILRIKNVLVAHCSWSAPSETSLDKFVQSLHMHLLKTGKHIASEDIVKYFKPIHEHYMNYLLLS